MNSIATLRSVALLSTAHQFLCALANFALALRALRHVLELTSCIDILFVFAVIVALFALLFWNYCAIVFPAIPLCCCFCTQPYWCACVRALLYYCVYCFASPTDIFLCLLALSGLFVLIEALILSSVMSVYILFACHWLMPLLHSCADFF